ncbi:MAG: hypothetical protein JKY00_15995 [Roseicyclus sp.]|nr:hypothetical protein [Roseicyclus sp.]
MQFVIHHLSLATLAVILTLAPFVASAQEAIIYDGDNCTGDYRMLHGDVRDLHAMEFDNTANSFRVFSGSWSFYRDAGYQERNGPMITVTDYTQNAICRGFDHIAASRGFSFPDNRLSAVELIASVSAQKWPPSPVAILYDQTHFRGQYRVLTRMTPDFHDIGFDNDAESVRVIRGIWVFYRNAGYGQTTTRPSLALGPGEYGDVASTPGYPANYFPQDLMSSAEALEN